jgi:hypothetical protein
MQLKHITAIIVLFLVVASLSAAGCTVTSTSSPTPTPTQVPTIVTPTPTAVKATPTPLPDYTAMLNNKTSGGYVVTTPFKKTTINGKVAYEGVVSKTGNAFKTQLFPMHSYSDALRYREELVASYKAQGYTTSYSANDDFWHGYLGNTKVTIGAQESLTLPQPYTSVEIITYS